MIRDKTGLKFLFAVTFVLAAAAGCTLDDVTGTNNRASSEEDIMAAGQILGEALSSDESGIILSLNDALTTFSEEQFTTSVTVASRSGRGQETDYQHSYRQKTGIHTVSFNRQVNGALFNKMVNDSLHYRFRNGAGDNVALPQQNRDRIASIYFDGRREGEITTLRKQSNFVRQDTIVINGFNSPKLSINGVHHGEGTMKLKPTNKTAFNRSYGLEINLLNISVSQSALSKPDKLWKEVSGTLSWQLSIGNNTASPKKLGGTIKLAGSGIAELNFQQSSVKYQVNLNNGDVKNQATEFEGPIASIDLAAQSLTLRSGRTLYLTAETNIDSEDFASLQAAKNSLSNEPVWAEGNGRVEGDRFIVSEIEFEREDDEDDENEKNTVEFEESVTAVDIANQTFTLGGRVVVQINNETEIDSEGDFKTLQEVSDALSDGTNITAEGEATENTGTSTADLTAVELEFKKTDNNSEED